MDRDLENENIEGTTLDVYNLWKKKHIYTDGEFNRIINRFCETIHSSDIERISIKIDKT